jgi:phenylalanyl-tRNA synthetase beta chain
MRVPLKWLKDYVKITLPVTELAEKLTLAGLEVGEIINTGGGWENVIIGEVIAINPHPNADRLKLATVNLGKERETVVCGAPNLTPGDKIAFARVGARLIHPETRTLGVQGDDLLGERAGHLGQSRRHHGAF